MTDTADTIRSTALFEGVSQETLLLVSTGARIRTYGPQEVILNEAEPAGGLWVVLDGRVKLSKTSSEGREQTLALLGNGDPFGLCTAFASNDFPAAAVAIRKTTVLAIPSNILQEAVQKEPLFLLNVIRVLSARLRQTMELVEAVSLKAIPQRVASFFLHEISGRGSYPGCSVELDMAHRELAKIIGATPEALSRALKKMSDEGLLKVEGRRVSLLNIPALEELAGG
jgi:CRP/FNR family transcriptional regulator